MRKGNSTHVKFGGWDTEGIDNQTSPEGLTFLKTKDATSWAIEIFNAKIGDREIEMPDTPKRFALIELAYPYIYMPQADFQNLAIEINVLYHDIGIDNVCQMTPRMTCVIPRPCS